MTLREYRHLAPWGVRDLAALAAGILDESGVIPINASARVRPTERTIRFYVAQGLVNSPEGRGTAAIYTYRHLLQVLAIKLRQMEGATLQRLHSEFHESTGDAIERRVAAALGPSLPRPSELKLLQEPGTARGRVGRAVQAWLVAPDADSGRSGTCRRIAVSPGVELLVDDEHPLVRLGTDPAVVAEACREALSQLLAGDNRPA